MSSREQYRIQERSPTSAFAARTVVVLASLALILSAFHFWPFDASRAWQTIGPTNVTVMALVAMMVLFALRNPRQLREYAPHVSVMAYVVITVLSLTFAPKLSRGLSFSGKLVLIAIGGYAAFMFAASTRRGLQALYAAATAAWALAVGGCVIGRLFFARDFGFFTEASKYGSYVAILTPLCGATMLTSPRLPGKLVGMLLIAATAVSAGTVGCILAVVVGLCVAAISLGRHAWPVGLALLFCFIGVVMLWHAQFISPLRGDARLSEKDGTNLRQQYIEWQALVNLLEERTATGSGAGCMNEYRSEYYYRLPKLNTLDPFNQNGWLTIAAETGILGLVCFVWMMSYHMTMAWRTRHRSRPAWVRRYGVANLAALAGACVAQAFSSFLFNGVLIVAILALSLAQAVALRLEDSSDDAQMPYRQIPARDSGSTVPLRER